MGLRRLTAATAATPRRPSGAGGEQGCATPHTLCRARMSSGKPSNLMASFGADWIAIGFCGESGSAYKFGQQLGGAVLTTTLHKLRAAVVDLQPYRFVVHGKLEIRTQPKPGWAESSRTNRPSRFREQLLPLLGRELQPERDTVVQQSLADRNRIGHRGGSPGTRIVQPPGREATPLVRGRTPGQLRFLQRRQPSD